MINSEVKKYINESVLCWLATSDSENIPNVSPKELFTYYNNDTLLIANIASPNSLKNIQSNKKVCVSFVNVFVQKGFKVKGEATIHKKNSSSFDIYYKSIRDLFGTKFPVSAIIEIKISRIDNIVAPSYFLFDNTTEENQIKNAMQVYKVTPINKN